MNNWERFKLAELAVRVGSGATPKGGKNAYPTTGVPLIRSMNVHFDGFRKDGIVFLDDEQANDLNGATVQAMDVLLNITGASIGRVTIAPQDMDGARVNQHVCIIRPKPAANPRFLSHFLASPVMQRVITEQQVGVTRQALTKGMILAFDVGLPPLAEQVRIVDEIEKQFTRLDAGVAALRRAEANLKRYKAAVLKAAVEGWLTERWRAEHPDVEPASELLKRILTERRRRWEQSELAKMQTKGKPPTDDRWKIKYDEPIAPDPDTLFPLPTGWTWATIDQLLDRGEYGTSVKCLPESVGVPVLRIPNIVEQEIDLANLKYATAEPNGWPECKLVPGDLLVCRTNGSLDLLGKTAAVREHLDGDYAFASYLIRLRLVMVDTLPVFVHHVFGSQHGRNFIEGHAASSAGQHNISLSTLQRFVVPLPPLPECKAIIESIEEKLGFASTLRAATRSNVRRADRLRQSILKRAFEGKLVPQDPTDEPASVLLDRIRAERQSRPDRRERTGRKNLPRRVAARRTAG